MDSAMKLRGQRHHIKPKNTNESTQHTHIPKIKLKRNFTFKIEITTNIKLTKNFVAAVE